MMRMAALVGVVIAFLMTERTSGELRCPETYCVMCSLPHGKTAQEVYGTRCRTHNNCTSVGHLCCIRDTFGKFCTPGVEDTPRLGQCPAVARLSLAERARRCPADMGNRCSFDVDCPQDHKCCVSSCGHKQCSAPAVGQTTASGRPPPPPQPSAHPAGTRTAVTYPIGGRGAAATTKAAIVEGQSKKTGVEGSGVGSKLSIIVERLRLRVARLLESNNFWKEKSARLRQLILSLRSGASTTVAKWRPKSATDAPAASGAPVVPSRAAAAGATQ